jgi:hypothetical protein
MSLFMCVYVSITKVFCSFVIIPVVYILQQWFDLGVMKALFSVLDTRIHYGMCSSTLPYAPEKRCVGILYTEYLC